MICMKNVRFSSRPRAKVRCQGPPGSARAQPWILSFICTSSLLCRCNLTRAIKSVKQCHDPCCRPPVDSTNYQKRISNFPSVWLANQQQLFKQANHAVCSNPCAKLGMQEKGFAAGMQLDLSTGLVLSLAQASSRVDSFRKLCSLF